MEFSCLDINFSSLFGTKKLLSPFETELEEVDFPNEDPITDPELRYVYKKKNSDNKEFFRVAQKHQVHTNLLQQKLSPKLPNPKLLKQQRRTDQANLIDY